MPNPRMVVHERLGTWARQIRARMAGRPIDWRETRSTADLEFAVAGAACPIVVIDLGLRPRAGLDALDRAMRTAPNALVLVLEPQWYEGVAQLARELGASEVISGPTPPPLVVALLTRWIPLARKRAEADGWSRTPEPEPLDEPWSWLAPYLA